MVEQSEMPRWEQVALRLEAMAAGPSEEQCRVAAALNIEIPANVPSTVAAVILRSHLAEALLVKASTACDLPEKLLALEKELGLDEQARLITGTKEEVSAWYASRYSIMSARGLRDVQPFPGDIVAIEGGPKQRYVVSSIGENGKVYMRGRPIRQAWPNHLKVIARVGDPQYSEYHDAIDADLRNNCSYRAVGEAYLSKLERFRVLDKIPSYEAIEALEILLNEGERKEAPFQKLLEGHPSLLAAAVGASWDTYVIPQKSFASAYVADFLVLSINSAGPQWLLVEIEGACHEMYTKEGRLKKEVRHAVDQIHDWREWLTDNVAYAQDTLNLRGITNRAPGLVIIGRGEPVMERNAARARTAKDEDIRIQSWDWLLRSARNLMTPGVEA